MFGDVSFYNAVLAAILLATLQWSLWLLCGPDDSLAASSPAATATSSPAAGGAAAGQKSPSRPVLAPFVPPEESPPLPARVRCALDGCFVAVVLVSILSVLAYEGGGDPLVSLAKMLPKETSLLGRALAQLRSSIGLL
jgi:hypothetical protein